MTSGQFYEGAICPKCKSKLPELRDEHSWGLATCPGCGERFNTNSYKKAGGRFHTGTGCKCVTCVGLENN